MNTVHITEINGIPRNINVPFVIRGHRKGKKAKPTKCYYCDGEIAVGEQYFRIDNYEHVCLGCAKYS